MANIIVSGRPDSRLNHTLSRMMGPTLRSAFISCHTGVTAATFGVWTLAALILSTQSLCYAEEVPAEIYKNARPAIVMVESTFKVEFSVPKASVDLVALEDLSSRTASLPPSSVGPRGAAGAMFREVLNTPLKFVKRSSEQEIVRGSSSGKSGGSGFIVTPEGHIVTNYHCVKIHEKRMDGILGKYVLRQDIEQALDQLAKKIPALAGLASPGPERVAWARVLQRAVARFYRSSGDIKEEVSVKVLTNPGRPQSEKTPEKYPARIVAEGELGPGKRDVAILKIDGSNMPTVSLGDDKNLAVGSRIYLIGFPGAAYDGRALSESSRLEPTIIGGLISAKKAVRDGWTLLQIDMNIASGSSGGPIFNTNGQVIGIASFALVKRSRGRTPERIHFAVPVSVIEEQLEKAGVKREKLKKSSERPR